MGVRSNLAASIIQKIQPIGLGVYYVLPQRSTISLKEWPRHFLNSRCPTALPLIQWRLRDQRRAGLGVAWRRHALTGSNFFEPQKCTHGLSGHCSHLCSKGKGRGPLRGPASICCAEYLIMLGNGNRALGPRNQAERISVLNVTSIHGPLVIAA